MDIEDDALMEEVRKVLRRMLGHPDAEPESESEKTGNIVPNEGRSSGAPRITDDQYAKDFVARIAGRIPAHSEQLPEDS